MPGQAVNLSYRNHFVRADVGLEDVFGVGQHIQETQFGIDNHHYMLMSLVVSVFHKLRLHHIAKLETKLLQSGNIRGKKLQNHSFYRFLVVLFKQRSVSRVQTCVYVWCFK